MPATDALKSIEETSDLRFIAIETNQAAVVRLPNGEAAAGDRADHNLTRNQNQIACLWTPNMKLCVQFTPIVFETRPQHRFHQDERE